MADTGGKGGGGSEEERVGGRSWRRRRKENHIHLSFLRAAVKAKARLRVLRVPAHPALQAYLTMAKLQSVDTVVQLFVTCK